MMERDTKMTRKITDLTRAELHKLVWEKPLKRLAPEFGLSGSALSGICAHNSIPYPSGGHWTKVALGRTVKPTPLPAAPAGLTDQIEIPPRRKRVRQSTPAPKNEAELTKTVAPPSALDISGLHPLIRAWITDHGRLQRERAAEIARHNKRDFFWTLTPIADLTTRDIYRFQMTSLLLRSLEKQGATIKEAVVQGKLSLGVGRHTIECVVTEKMTRRPSPRRELWTAFENHHQGGLVSTGFLRITITTYLQPGIPEWVETPKRKMEELIPEIVSRILGAGPCLDRMEAERREREREYAEREARRAEIARLHHLEKVRFERFSELSTDWHRAQRLSAFIAQLENRLGTEGDVSLEGRTLSDWIAWAKQKTDRLDPFHKETINIFKDFVGGDGY